MSAQKNGPASEQEPSMEEILSSIKKIIADDEDPKSKSAKSQEKDMKEATNDEDVLQLTEVVPEPKKNGKTAKNDSVDDTKSNDISSASSAPVGSPKDGAIALEDEIDFEADFEGESAEPIADHPASNGEKQLENGLLSESTATASTHAFSKMAKAVQGGEVPSQFKSDGRTIEMFVGDLLRPSLKEWLDRNLERIVREVVEQEVKKLARRAELL